MKCELCDAPATSEAATADGLTVPVCDEHLEALSANTAERRADRFFEENYRND